MVERTDVPAAVRDLARQLAEDTYAPRDVVDPVPAVPQAGLRLRRGAGAAAWPSTTASCGSYRGARSLVTCGRVETLRRQIDAGQGFRQHVAAYWQACERWADTELDTPPVATPQKRLRKRASKWPSRLRPSRRSKR